MVHSWERKEGGREAGREKRCQDRGGREGKDRSGRQRVSSPAFLWGLFPMASAHYRVSSANELLSGWITDFFSLFRNIQFLKLVNCSKKCLSKGKYICYSHLQKYELVYLISKLKLVKILRHQI